MTTTPSMSVAASTRRSCGTIQAKAGRGQNGVSSVASSSPVAPNSQQPPV
jgi:hypothetical protein